MAIELREEVGFCYKEVSDIKEDYDLIESTEYNAISEDSVMVKIEGIHSIITKNLNYYEPHCLENSIPKWTYPYEKPLIMHHNDRNGVIIGRIKEAKYIEKNTRSKTPGILFTCNVGSKEGVEGVKNGTLATVSIGATVYDLRCSICGQNLAEEGECEHIKGHRYDGKLCFWIVKEMEPKELSYVIVPSDKYAHNLKVYEPTLNSSKITESYNDNEVKELSIKDLYYDELSKEIAQKEAKRLEEAEKDNDKIVDEVDDSEKEDIKNETPKDEDIPKDKDIPKDEEKSEDNDTLEELKTLRAKVEELLAEVTSLKTKLKKEESLRESAETKLLEVRKKQKISLAEQINELRNSLDLESEDVNLLIESSEEVLNSKIEVLKNFTGNISKIANKMPNLKSASLIEEEQDNTVVYDKKVKENHIDIEKVMIEKYKKLINRD